MVSTKVRISRCISPSYVSNHCELLARELAQRAALAFEERLDERALLGLQRQYLLLDRVLGDQAIGRDRACLADAVRAVDGLALDGRVPPGSSRNT